MNKKTILIIILIILAGIFYWFEIRPRNIKNRCLIEAQKESDIAKNADNSVIDTGLQNVQRADYDKIFEEKYQRCLILNNY